MKLSENQDDGRRLIAAWRTNNRVTAYLIENLPPELWAKPLPGAPRQTVRSRAAHIHNVRCAWVKMIGARHGVTVPRAVNAPVVRKAELLRALARSSAGIVALTRLGLARGGAVPPARWQNFPTDLVHFLCYFVAHEAHHSGRSACSRGSWATGCRPMSWAGCGNGKALGRIRVPSWDGFRGNSLSSL